MDIKKIIHDAKASKSTATAARDLERAKEIEQRQKVINKFNSWLNEVVRPLMEEARKDVVESGCGAVIIEKKGRESSWGTPFENEVSGITLQLNPKAGGDANHGRWKIEFFWSPIAEQVHITSSKMAAVDNDLQTHDLATLTKSCVEKEIERVIGLAFRA